MVDNHSANGSASVSVLSFLLRLHDSIRQGKQVAEALLWFFLAMVAFPEKQRKCQEELDAVVGRSRMPVVDDGDNLPYMRATVRELLRWRPISPLGRFPTNL